MARKKHKKHSTPASDTPEVTPEVVPVQACDAVLVDVQTDSWLCDLELWKIRTATIVEHFIQTWVAFQSLTTIPSDDALGSFVVPARARWSDLVSEHDAVVCVPSSSAFYTSSLLDSSVNPDCSSCVIQASPSLMSSSQVGCSCRDSSDDDLLLEDAIWECVSAGSAYSAHLLVCRDFAMFVQFTQNFLVDVMNTLHAKIMSLRLSRCSWRSKRNIQRFRSVQSSACSSSVFLTGYCLDESWTKTWESEFDHLDKEDERSLHALIDVARAR
eukprot:TRINITY_DN25828_c0_g1_i2.p1 TRINITY_DN25828_c0_g1~~TRINITY_DN25828_c0_g1_i2.p1  ORF type:complete len:271 (-),score=9.71 TRINITY_DN25828_c0_g1_i2:366-1178(-)